MVTIRISEEASVEFQKSVVEFVQEIEGKEPEQLIEITKQMKQSAMSLAVDGAKKLAKQVKLTEQSTTKKTTTTEKTSEPKKPEPKDEELM